MSFKLKEGINKCTNEQYHSDKSYLSSSNLKMLLKNPEQFKKEVIQGIRENKQVNAFDEGNYAHSLILEPQHIPDEYAFFPGFRKAGADWVLFKEMNKGKILLSKPQKHRVEKWVDAYRERKEAVKLISGGMPEHSVAGDLMGVNIKVRADYINVDKGYVADVKTTSYQTDVDTFRHVVNTLNYDLSAALYCQMFEKYYGRPFEFYFIVLGKRDMMCEVYKASEETMEKGSFLVREAIMKYKQCKKTGIWTDTKKDVFESDSDYEIREV